jgi:uncharacterized membrane protein YoaK (UPF0700 family)
MAVPSHSNVPSQTGGRAAFLPVPSIDGSLSAKLLPWALSATAGSVDVIGFLGLNGLFTAHITGNLVILVSHLSRTGDAQTAHILSVPVFIGVLGLARLLAVGLEAIGLRSLRPFLALQVLLLAGFLVLAAGPPFDPETPRQIAGAMFGVSAMAVQNVLVQLSLDGAPSTAVMTTNITRFTMDVGTVLFGRDPEEASRAGKRARHTWPAIVGFTLGCAAGGVGHAAFGMLALALPTGFALVALGLGTLVERTQRADR